MAGQAPAHCHRTEEIRTEKIRTEELKTEKVNAWGRMMLGIRSLDFPRGAALAALLAIPIVSFVVTFIVTPAAAAKDPTIDDLKARLSSTSIGDRPQLCLQIAERQLDDAANF